MNRQEFLARIRTAAESGRRFRVHPNEAAATAPLRGEAPADLVEAYVREATSAGGRVQLCRDWSSARDELAQWLVRYEPRVAACWRHPTLKKLRLESLLDEHGIERVDAETLHRLGRDVQRERILAADIGITSAACAVAETGSLLCAHALGQERVASLAPPVYFAVVERSQIVADLFDAFTWLHDNYGLDVPSNATFISGPSKTGDIETKLVTGVHGPGKWHVIVVDAE
jgi:L-lactate dehydrogenase complex protein LldG